MKSITILKIIYKTQKTKTKQKRNKYTTKIK